MEQEARERDSEEASTGGSTKSSISITEPETQSDLLAKLMTLLVIEKIPGILSVRKGRVSLIINFDEKLINFIFSAEHFKASFSSHQRSTNSLGYLECHL